MSASEPRVDPIISSNLTKNQTYRTKTKSIVLAYMLWLFLGIVAAHRFYLGRNESAWILILFVITPVLLHLGLVILDVMAPPLGHDLSSYVGYLSVFIWLFPLVRWLADFIRMPGYVRDYNDKVWREVMGP